MSSGKNKKQSISSGRIAWIVERWAIPLLLVAVALRQILLVHTVGLTPWKGGGFGMFSSVDKARSRLIVLQGINSEGQPIQMELGSLNQIFSKTKLRLLKTIPRKKLLQQLADKVLNSELRPTKNEGIYRLTPEKSPLSPPVNLQTVKVQVWNLQFEPQTHQIWYQPLSPEVEASK